VIGGRCSGERRAIQPELGAQNGEAIIAAKAPVGQLIFRQIEIGPHWWVVLQPNALQQAHRIGVTAHSSRHADAGVTRLGIVRILLAHQQFHGLIGWGRNCGNNAVDLLKLPQHWSAAWVNARFFQGC